MKKNNPPLKLAYTRNDVKINHCQIGGKYPTETFIDGLGDNEKISLVALFQIFADHKGRLKNGGKFKKLETYLEEAILEFKDYQVRLAGFWRKEYNFNLVYGMIKKQDQWPSKDLNAMRANYKAYVEAHEK